MMSSGGGGGGARGKGGDGAEVWGWLSEDSGERHCQFQVVERFRIRFDYNLDVLIWSIVLFNLVY
jgi:hypothetical protein